MMNRRRFVKTLGTSAISSTWVFAGEEILRKVNSASPTDAGISTAHGVSQAGGSWPRPVLVPLPKDVGGIPQPIVDLAGTWKLTIAPPAEFWENGVDPAGWTDITVPGELTAQGIEFARDNEFAYKRALQIPAELTGKTVLLRFDGVYSYARVWVNGKFVREHHGGFTSWDCNITEHVTPGQTAWITVGVTDRADEISYASNYAKHYIGGILRGVKLVVLPAVHVSRLHVETDFGSSFKDGHLKVMARAEIGDSRGVMLNLRLTDPEGRTIPLSPSSVAFSADKPEASIEIPVSSPIKWDAEHPNLYTLGAELLVHKSTLENVPSGVDCYDLFSEHYPKVSEDLTNKDFPKLNDEYAHISCYNTETLKRDPRVRNFYGLSINQFWENCYNADGCLGGAIWAGFDEVFMLPGAPVGYGEWGIVDGWRRPKPEYWLTKKAYSPPLGDQAATLRPGTQPIVNRKSSIFG